jgi:hypothetical protein
MHADAGLGVRERLVTLLQPVCNYQYVSILAVNPVVFVNKQDKVSNIYGAVCTHGDPYYLAVGFLVMHV